MRLFSYGTLQFPLLMARISGIARPGGHPAVLHDYGCYTLTGAVYPGIRHEPGAQTQGVVYDGLDGGALARLDRFEGDEYQRKQLEVQLADAQTIEVWVYVFRPELGGRLSSTVWDRERFERYHLASWLRGSGRG